MVFICPYLNRFGLWEDHWCCWDCHHHGFGSVHIIAGCNVAACCEIDRHLHDGRLTYDQLLTVVRQYHKEFPSAD